MTQAQVDAILKQGRSDVTVPIVAPIGGHVLKKNVVEGQYVQEGQTMFEIADLHTVWIKAPIYEDEVGLVHEGTGAGGQRNVLTRVVVTVEFAAVSGVLPLTQEIEKFAALYSACCSMLGSIRASALKSPLLIVVPGVVVTG